MSGWTFRTFEDSDMPRLRKWFRDPEAGFEEQTIIRSDRQRFWKGTDVSWPPMIAQFGSKELRAVLAEAHPDFDYDPEKADFDSTCIEVYVASINEEPVGAIQCYPVDEYSDEAEVQAWLNLGFDRTGAGVDFLIGNPAERGRGLGSSMLSEFIDEVVFGRHPSWTQVGSSPAKSNAGSCRALAKAGLEVLGSIETPGIAGYDLYAKRRRD